MIEDRDGNYSKVSSLVDGWLELHKGETFDLDKICRQLVIQERENRHNVIKKLSYEVKQGSLEKSNSIYRYIDNTRKVIDWVNAPDADVIELSWPHGHEGSEFGIDSEFGFTKNIVVSPGDIHVIAGVSNMGKTTWCHNLLWENMDDYLCTLMGNEYVGSKFKRRVKRMDWKNPINEKGESKFELIDRRKDWKDIIRPDSINIVDWINLPGDKTYDIGRVLEDMQSKIVGGILVAVLQKNEANVLARGGTFSLDLSSLYLAIDFERLTVVKAKEWHGENPNGKVYGFKIVDGGTKFHNIREIVKCRSCWGSGKHRGEQCDDCLGSGWVDKE